MTAATSRRYAEARFEDPEQVWKLRERDLQIQLPPELVPAILALPRNPLGSTGLVYSTLKLSMLK